MALKSQPLHNSKTVPWHPKLQVSEFYEANQVTINSEKGGEQSRKDILGSGNKKK